MSGLAIGDVAERTGLAVSAIRFYEEHGIVRPLRNAGGHRRYDRADIRRLSFVMIAQRLGFPLARIAALLEELPDERRVTKADWTRLSTQFRGEIDARIAALERLRDRLDGCIGCGCLSLESCALHNPDDAQAKEGPGPRKLLDEDGQLPG
ncbi:redox-sensitive transcriptional activator SoxR [Pseudoroseicyclus tamaricis]|uniref:Redox-sensitive transcriptional activator SoxR n=1 Tax=Pseudoroseicyclus tamaricis TaxID=2705421 RepID=A0A6B2JT32_9RHOB|nr:redox-sensitive transcriptional activator SoxR [Pseudoroseicyclus tamaricis]NDV01717.1 redox-sensitive transcriptional activator SoxR [Pseudoroseicyclus tamaricis]